MRRLLLVVVLSLLAFAAGTSGQPANRTPMQVLFIGNSLTSTNNLPAMIEALSAAAGGPRVTCSSVAVPNFSLEDHWNQGTAARAIARGGWSTVVLQQGPSALPESRVLLIEYTRKFAAEARRVGAQTALYMVWPSAGRRGDFDGVRMSYNQAAGAVGGLFLPVGQAWRTVWKRDSGVELYQTDGFHPTPQATYLAALVILERLAGVPPAGLPANLTSAAFPAIALPPARAALLQQAAAEANRVESNRGER